jgi:LPXTG-motif cell wall-anchored protein
MTVIGAAAPASADIITEPRCDTFNDHVSFAEPDLDGDWYMECVPQYGLGKAEFTLEAPDAGFPAGFDPLTADRVDTPDSSGLTPYFGDVVSDPEDPDEAIVPNWVTPVAVDDASTPESQVLQALVFAPVASVGSLDVTPDEVLAACSVGDSTPYITFVSTYSPVTTTFSFTDGGVTYSAPVTITPDPTYYLFIGDPLDEEEDGSTICVTDSRQTASGSFDSLSVAIIGLFTVPPFVWFEGLDSQEPDAGFDNLPDLGTFAFAAPAVEEEEDPTPELAATGTETAPLGVGAGFLTGAGALLFAFSRRRRQKVRATVG